MIPSDRRESQGLIFFFTLLWLSHPMQVVSITSISPCQTLKNAMSIIWVNIPLHLQATHGSYTNPVFDDYVTPLYILLQFPFTYRLEKSLQNSE